MSTTRTPSASRTLPAQHISAEVLLEKYAKGDETNADGARVATFGQGLKRPLLGLLSSADDERRAA